MKFFKPEDFSPEYGTWTGTREEAVYWANKKLQNNIPKCIWKFGSSQTFVPSAEGFVYFESAKKCEHPLDKIKTTYYHPFGKESHWYKCEDCGANVKPGTFIGD